MSGMKGMLLVSFGVEAVHLNPFFVFLDDAISKEDFGSGQID